MQRNEAMNALYAATGHVNGLAQGGLGMLAGAARQYDGGALRAAGDTAADLEKKAADAERQRRVAALEAAIAMGLPSAEMTIAAAKQIESYVWGVPSVASVQVASAKKKPTTSKKPAKKAKAVKKAVRRA